MQKRDKTEKCQNAQLFIIDYQRYRGSNTIMIYIDCNRILKVILIESHLKMRIQVF